MVTWATSQRVHWSLIVNLLWCWPYFTPYFRRFTSLKHCVKSAQKAVRWLEMSQYRKCHDSRREARLQSEVVIPAICAISSIRWLLVLGTERFKRTTVALIVEQQSLFYVLSNWLVFFGRMMLIALVLLPLATVTLAISQLVNSQCLSFSSQAMRLSFCLSPCLDFMASMTSSLSSSLPMNLLTTSNPFSVIAEAPVLSLGIYVLIVVLAAICWA